MSKEYQRDRRKRKKIEKQLLLQSESDEDNVDHYEDSSIADNFVETDHDNGIDQFDTDFSDDFDSDSPFEEEEETIDLKDNLAAWACRHNLTRSCINEVLDILRDHGHANLPKDSRTLLQTPKSVLVEKKFGGMFSYLGVKNEMVRIIEEGKNVPDKIFQININIDGLPLFKSSNQSLWPILGLFTNSNSPFPIAVFCGNGKPSDCQLFLEAFLSEYEELHNNGIMIEDKQYFLEVNAIVCDAPARQFLKCIKAHNAYYGCERCIVKGEYVERRMIFESIHEPLRTSEEFNSMVYQEHQHGCSPFIDSSIDVLRHFPLDYMHLVLLGTVRRLLIFLKEGPRICRISSRQTHEISERLCRFKNKIPSEFARQPRGLDELKRWKATEFRQFLLFTGPVVLKGIIDEKFYVHFLALSVAMRIFLESNDHIRNDYKDYAKSLLEYFVEKASSLYGRIFLTYNIHSLVHLHQDSEQFNASLDTISAFPFENYMQTLKRTIKNANNPVAQVVKRKHEINIANSCRLKKQLFTSISANGKDSWFILKSFNIAQIQHKINNEIYKCNVFHHESLFCFFEQPCKSSITNIFKVGKGVKSYLKDVSHNDFVRKLVCLELCNGDLYCCSLLHDVKFN